MACPNSIGRSTFVQQAGKMRRGEEQGKGRIESSEAVVAGEGGGATNYPLMGSIAVQISLTCDRTLNRSSSWRCLLASPHLIRLSHLQLGQLGVHKHISTTGAGVLRSPAWHPPLGKGNPCLAYNSLHATSAAIYATQ